MAGDNLLSGLVQRLVERGAGRLRLALRGRRLRRRLHAERGVRQLLGCHQVHVAGRLLFQGLLVQRQLLLGAMAESHHLGVDFAVQVGSRGVVRNQAPRLIDHLLRVFQLGVIRLGRALRAFVPLPVAGCHPVVKRRQRLAAGAGVDPRPKLSQIALPAADVALPVGAQVLGQFLVRRRDENQLYARLQWSNLRGHRIGRRQHRALGFGHIGKLRGGELASLFEFQIARNHARRAWSRIRPGALGEQQNPAGVALQGHSLGKRHLPQPVIGRSIEAGHAAAWINLVLAVEHKAGDLLVSLPILGGIDFDRREARGFRVRRRSQQRQ